MDFKTTTLRGKTEKDVRDPKTLQRRNSIPEDTGFRELLKEMQKISDKQDLLQKEIHGIAVKQDLQQKILQEEMTILKKEIKEEICTIKLEVAKNVQEIQEIKTDNIRIERTQLKLQQKVETMEFKNTKLEKMQEKIEQNEAEYQLRFRNIEEDPKENIKQIITKITAEVIQCSEREAAEQIDSVYRLHTNYAKKIKVARDVIAHFVKKSFRNEILYNSRTKSITYNTKRIMILKEFPPSTINKRKKYFFLTDELKRLQIRFRWEKQEGLMLTYKGEKIWIKTEEKADQFYRKLKKDLAQRLSPQSSSEEKNPKKAKKRRQESPKEVVEEQLISILGEDQEALSEEEEEGEKMEDALNE
nr:PREDICTED: uncharacterized protein PF11_0207-like [Anolis carolinensis]|eukprot:XP_016850410.1 PREDICTED: uncharacterized protein PF11_0207-like [Anolis carolinensis]